MNYHERCSHCGHKITAYTIFMNEGLITAFIAFAESRIQAGRPLAKGELGLANAQYTNFQNLRHFGLITQPEGKGRHWEMTKTGWDFFRGTCWIKNPAGHLGGITIHEGHPAWATHDGVRKWVKITDVLPVGYKLRSEYQEEKAGVL
jgi:hypothetical protein